MDLTAFAVAFPFAVGTLLRTGRMRGVSRLYLRSRWWKWLLLVGLGAALVLALRAHAWLTAGLVASFGWLATWEREDFTR